MQGEGVGDPPPVLTRAAGELGLLPGPVLAAADEGRAAGGEAAAALVAGGGADLVAWLGFAEGVGIAHGGGGPALHCEQGGGQLWAPPVPGGPPP